MNSTRASKSLEQALDERVLLTYQSMQQEYGVHAVQAALREISSHEVETSKRFFNRFHSWLRFANPDTPSNAYRTSIFGPLVDYIGKQFNFLNDDDCELLAELTTSKKANVGARPYHYFLRQTKTWLAITKLLLSLPGVIIRGVAIVLDFTLDSLFSPLRCLKNLFAAVRQPREFSKHLLRSYQILTPNKKLTTTTENQSDIQIRTLTLNTGLLRDIFWLNKPYLNYTRRPRIRAHEIAKELLNRSSECDVICLQEVFDNLAYMGFGKDSRTIIIDALKNEYPYIVYDIGHRSYPFVNSGMMVLSKHPILEVDYQRYHNVKGLEVFSNKGFVGVKIQKGDRFFTVYNTHTQSNLDVTTNKLALWLRSFYSDRKVKKDRDKQFDLMHEHYQAWANQPPKNAPHLKYTDTIMMGDLNHQMDTVNKIYGISSGKRNHEKKGRVKYSGLNRMMRALSPQLPDNCLSSRYAPDVGNFWGRVREAHASLLAELCAQHPASNPTEISAHIEKQFQPMSGSWVWLGWFGPHADKVDYRDSEPNLDICYPADFDKPKKLATRGLQAGKRTCLLFKPRIPGVGDHYTDHAGLQASFSYQAT